MRVRLWPLALLACIGGLLIAPVARAQGDYPPTTPTFVLFDANGNPTRIFSPGEAGRLIGDGLLDSTDYSLFFHQSPGQLLNSAASDPIGHLEMPFRIPTTAHAGPATLSVESAADAHDVGIDIVASSGLSLLPRTGAEIRRMAVWATMLLAVGLAFVGYARRRRARSRPSLSEADVWQPN
jgi:hypothetical protein